MKTMNLNPMRAVLAHCWADLDEEDAIAAAASTEVA